MALHLVATTFLGWFSSLAGRFLSDTALRFVAYKVLLITLLTVTLPIVLKNLFTWLFYSLAFAAVSSIDPSGLSSSILHFTGISGYLASHLMLADCLSIIITAMIIRFKLNFIPFIG